jgi:hypothetical protein
MRVCFPPVIVGLTMMTFSTIAAAEARLVVNANANQFPYVSVKVLAYDPATGKPIAGLRKEQLVVSEDLSPVAIESFKLLSSAVDRPKEADVMFVFDETGSMSEEIAGLIQRTRKFADTISRSGINYRLGLVSFSDAVEKKYDYTQDVEQFKKNVSALVASGGGDEPENQLDALMEASKFSIRSGAKRVFILVTDASYHFQDGVTKRRPEDVIAAFRAQGIQLHVVGPELDSYKSMSQKLVGNFYDKDSDDFTSIVSTIGGEISANYEFAYRSPRMINDGTRRSVRVALQGDAGTDAAQYVAPWFVTASSRQDASRGDESPYAPQKVLDGDGATAWFPSEIGLANAEWLHMTLPVARTVAKVTVDSAQGYPFSEQRSATLSVEGGEDIKGRMDADGRQLTFQLPKPVPIRHLQLDLHVPSGRLGIADVNAFLPDGSPVPEIDVHHVSVAKRDSARETNSKGEKAYHAGDVAGSVELYQAAIKADPDFAQAYSNLGLSYWKLGKYADSVAANRAAIALGKQQGNLTVIASSYYNIAKTFEEQKEFKQALMNFWWANKTTPKPTYVKAIQRMNAAIAKDAE